MTSKQLFGAMSAAALLAITAACGGAETEVAEEPAEAMPADEIVLNVERIVPESITSDSAGNIYIGNVIGNNVYRVPAGTTDTEQFIASGSNGLERVLGVFADEAHGLLWVCSTGSMPPAVASFDLATGEPEGRYDLPGEGPTCNDIAVRSDGAVYIGETSGGGVVWKASDSDTMEVLVMDDLLASADGVAILDDNTLIVNGVQTGKLVRVDLNDDGTFAGLTDLTLSRELEGPDGMRTIGPNTLLIGENRAGRMTIATVNGDNVELETLRDGFMSNPGVTAARGMGWSMEGQFALMRDEAAEPMPFILYGAPLP